ncbi:hypothetical protein Hanom_Chr08g00724201 [Helianthus anomalus]
MFMPAPKTGEGSSSEGEAVIEPNQDRTQEAPSSPDSEELFEDNETAILMKRITALEEDKIFEDVQIASLIKEITHKNQKIQELKTNLGSLTVVVMDLKQKLEGKFPKGFAEPPKESTAEERAQQQKEHEEAMDCYIQNPP